MAQCLSEQQIEDLAAGVLADTEAQEMTAHVEQCPQCQAAFEECRANLAFVSEVHGDLAVCLGRPGDDPLRTPLSTFTQDLGRNLDTLPPADSIPGYQIVREIHRGGQGVVYEAVQLSTRRTVAVKIMLEGPFASERSRWRFDREVKLIAALRHPNIVVIHDSGVAQGKYYFAMEYVRGQPLDTHVRLAGLAVRDMVRLFKQVCDAVAHAHRRGVIHRDLKPSNVLVSEEGTPRILDFGLAKMVGAVIEESQGGLASITGNLMGTVPYMSPEQTTGDPEAIDTRTDVYALGVILYELLTGGPPYRTTGVDIPTAIENIRTVDPPRPSRLRRQLSSEIDAIVLKAMAKEPQRRYQSADELGADLLAWLEGRPVTAKSDSSFYVLRKLAFRHSFESLVIITLLLSMGSFATIGVQLQLRAREAVVEQQRSEQALAEKNEGLEEFHQQAQAALRQQALGWFLLEWAEDRPELARSLAADQIRGSPEQIVMSFLLDDGYSEEQLLRDLPAEARALGYFAAGERHRKAGRTQEALACLQASVASATPRYEWIKRLAKLRIRQLRESEALILPDPASHPAAQEVSR